MTVTSFAQAKEDILLLRALKHVSHEVGFYIDVGGFHPEVDSVTKLFYDHGWRGVNCEPVPELVRLFERDRPRDVNLQVAVSDRTGEITFHNIKGHQLGTVVEEFAHRHEAAGLERESYTVPTLTLTQICERYAPSEIHFLKIDVEGHEGSVIRGMDFKRFRPWVLVVEATEPNRLDVPTYEEWDKELTAAGYRFVYTDVLNRYYVSEEHADLASCFSVPADDYVLAKQANLSARLEAAERRISELMNARQMA
jgi:FkbM family methyltransferase